MYGNTFANHVDLHRLEPDLVKYRLNIIPCELCHFVIIKTFKTLQLFLNLNFKIY